MVLGTRKVGEVGASSVTAAELSYSAEKSALQQIRRLLGVLPMPGPEQIETRAERAVHGFLGLFDPSTHSGE